MIFIKNININNVKMVYIIILNFRSELILYCNNYYKFKQELQYNIANRTYTKVIFRVQITKQDHKFRFSK